MQNTLRSALMGLCAEWAVLRSPKCFQAAATPYKIPYKIPYVDAPQAWLALPGTLTPEYDRSSFRHYSASGCTALASDQTAALRNNSRAATACPPGPTAAWHAVGICEATSVTSTDSTRLQGA